MAGKCAGATGSVDSNTVGLGQSMRMGTRVVRAYAEGRLAGAGNHPAEAAGSAAYIAFAWGVTNTADAAYKLES